MSFYVSGEDKKEHLGKGVKTITAVIKLKCRENLPLSLFLYVYIYYIDINIYTSIFLF